MDKVSSLCDLLTESEVKETLKQVLGASPAGLNFLHQKVGQKMVQFNPETEISRFIHWKFKKMSGVTRNLHPILMKAVPLCLIGRSDIAIKTVTVVMNTFIDLGSYVDDSNGDGVVFLNEIDDSLEKIILHLELGPHDKRYFTLQKLVGLWWQAGYDLSKSAELLEDDSSSDEEDYDQCDLEQLMHKSEEYYQSQRKRMRFG
ncbi:2,3,4,5-tetrahydropyridine-2,6-dicarboxylate N-succinyltransferase [Acrasis kona]|uniref:2,3,4,5-tetrahydropyridine-2,6-dicarboxylate N-succinyltransferase n=1 Tax=Acrasis kona TaxID=1008807 RepID=A0AAW2YV53_9EUKA